MKSDKDRMAAEMVGEIRSVVTRYQSTFDGIRLAENVRDGTLAATENVPRTAFVRALARGLPVREAAKQEEGGSISADEAARILGLSKTSVLVRFSKGQILGWRETKQKAVRFPIWQFGEEGMLPGLPEVLDILSQAELDDWGRVMFFLNPRNSLEGKRPLDALKEGRLPLVKRLAWGDFEN
jgi:hypothetical protein